LTGLRPALTELEHVLADRSSDAYEKVVDRLLASPRYGERMAVTGLTRLATPIRMDTRSIRKGNVAVARLVIGPSTAICPNDGSPSSQLAGDLLPTATLDQKIATGFQRNHRINSETGSIAEEFHTETRGSRQHDGRVCSACP